MSKSMKLSWWCVVAAMVGCGGGGGGGAGAGDLKALRGKMCGCKDQACVDAVQKEVDAANAKVLAEVKKPEDVSADVAKYNEQIGRCRTATVMLSEPTGAGAGSAAAGSGAAGTAVAAGSAAAGSAAPGSAAAAGGDVAAGAGATTVSGTCAALTTSQFGALMFTMMKGNLPPGSPDLARMGTHEAELVASINTAMATACTRDAWAASAVACIAKATTTAELDPCEAELNADQTAKLGEALSGAMAAMFPAGIAPAPVAAADRPKGSASACDDYVVVVNKLSKCDKVPAQVKEAAQKSVGQIKAAVGMLDQPGIPEESKQATYDACKQAATQLAQAAASMGCTL